MSNLSKLMEWYIDRTYDRTYDALKREFQSQSNIPVRSFKAYSRTFKSLIDSCIFSFKTQSLGISFWLTSSNPFSIKNPPHSSNPPICKNLLLKVLIGIDFLSNAPFKYVLRIVSVSCLCDGSLLVSVWQSNSWFDTTNAKIVTAQSVFKQLMNWLFVLLKCDVHFGSWGWIWVIVSFDKHVEQMKVCSFDWKEDFWTMNEWVLHVRCLIWTRFRMHWSFEERFILMEMRMMSHAHVNLE